MKCGLEKQQSCCDILELGQTLLSDSSANQIGEQLDDLKTLESVMSEMLKNVLSSASSGETILTAKPINIVQK